MSTAVDDKAVRESLLNNVKQEVKRLMELSVTRKVIHEENSRITSLCGKSSISPPQTHKASVYFIHFI